MGVKIFPKGFLWGTATASHQNEGQNFNNDFWIWEQMPGHVVDGTNSKQAANWWQDYIHDFDLMQNLGYTSLRLSIEWSRIEPKEGIWDKEALVYYQSMLKDLRARNITPMVTLHHFTNPFWLAEMGGWYNPKVVAYFARYVAKVVEMLGDLCSLWCTINEPLIYGTQAYLVGRWYPGHKKMQEFVRVTKHQILAHIQAYKMIHDKQPHAQVGCAQHFAAFRPLDNSYFSRKIAEGREEFLNWRFLSAIEKGQWKFPCCFWPKSYKKAFSTNDFFGINYYGRHIVQFSPYAIRELFGRSMKAPADIAWPAPWQDREIYPQGLGEFAEQTYQRYTKPIYITENGMADTKDSIRPKFLLAHLLSLHKAIEKGIPIRGFYHWTFCDNYEWVEGWTTRFGLVALDPSTQKRTLRQSATLYSKIAQKNGITEDIVTEYAPELIPVFCKP